MTEMTLTCEKSQRRNELFKRNTAPVNKAAPAVANGIDYVDAQMNADATSGTITLHFFQPVQNVDPANVHIEAVERGLTNESVKCTTPASSLQDGTHTVFEVSPVQRQRAYRLKLRHWPPSEGLLDPQFSMVEFVFSPSDLTETDFLPRREPPRATRPEPTINYLAKDYSSFRQLIIDRLALTMPDWRERHAADLGMALVELLAYTGDRLSYYQDAVATEAYLSTARRRISVRRHARLVDYKVHEGCNARTFVQIQADQDASFDPPDVFFITRPPQQAQIKSEDVVLSEQQLPPEILPEVISFEPLPAPPLKAEINDDDISQLSDFVAKLSGLLNGLAPVFRLSGELLGLCGQISTLTSTEKARALIQELLAALNRCLDEEQLWTTSIVKKCSEATRRAVGYLSKVSRRRCNRAILDDLLSGTLAFSNQTGIVRQFRNLNEIHFYTWNQQECWLPVGTTKATLLDQTPAKNKTVACNCKAEPTPGNFERVLGGLSRGDILIVEEVFGAKTGREEDADPAHRQALRLTKVTQDVDPITNVPIVEIEWHSEDALKFPLCISSRQNPPNCTDIDPVSVARGNVVLADHGLTQSYEKQGTVQEERTQLDCGTECEPPTIVRRPLPFDPKLDKPNLTFAAPFDEKVDLSAAALLAQKPEDALPAVWLQAIPATARGATLPLLPDDFDPVGQPEKFRLRYRQLAPEFQYVLQDLLTPDESFQLWKSSQPTSSQLDKYELNKIVERLRQATTWKSAYDLLDCAADAQQFVVETDDLGSAHLRFGDGQCGKQPASGTQFFATYRIGGGIAGNIGANAIQHIVFRRNARSYRSVTNPLPAKGGTDRQSLTEVKLQAPYAYQKRRLRAIIARDYAELVLKTFRDRVIEAQASLSWAGTYWLAAVVIHPRSSVGNDAAVQKLCTEIEDWLFTYRRIGHVVRVTTGIPVPLTIAMIASVQQRYLQTDVHRALMDLFSNRDLPGGRHGLFHPDNLRFGEPVYISKLVTEAKRVPGVENVNITKLARYAGESANSDVNSADEGLLKLGPLELARLDNNGDPTRGLICLELRGGR